MTFNVDFAPLTKVARFGAGRGSKYPWSQLTPPEKDQDGNELYSGFFVPGKTTKKFSSLAQMAAKRYNIKLTVRAVEQDGVKGVRVSRVDNPNAPVEEAEAAE